VQGVATVNERTFACRMTLDPQAQVVFDAMAQNPGPKPRDLPVPEFRAAIDDLSRYEGLHSIVTVVLSAACSLPCNTCLGVSCRPMQMPEVMHVKNLAFPGIKGPMQIRLYNPNPHTSAPQPALIFIHGGGWCINTIDTHDSVCRGLANEAGIVVLSVDYRLAPEHPFPAGLEDCYAASQWIHSNAKQLSVDPTRLALGGDSAGGNLTAAVLMLTHERHGAPIVFQLQLYPCVHMKAHTESRKQFAWGYVLDLDFCDWVMASYAGEGNLDDPLMSPLLAKDLSFMPPALVITAGHDPLRDEGKQYAERLQQQGVQCMYKCFEGMLHGFLNQMYIVPMDVGGEAMALCASQLKDALKC